MVRIRSLVRLLPTYMRFKGEHKPCHTVILPSMQSEIVGKRIEGNAKLSLPSRSNLRRNTWKNQSRYSQNGPGEGRLNTANSLTLTKSRYIAPLKPAFAPFIPQPIVKNTLPTPAKCVCPQSVTKRNQRLFEHFGSQWEPTSKLTGRLKALVKPSHCETRKVVFVHIDGVLVEVAPKGPFEALVPQYYLRPGAVEGLKCLGLTFDLVYFSAYKPRRINRILSCLRARKVPVSGAYWIQAPEAESISSEKWSFQDYSSVFEDLNIRTEASSQVLLIAALRAEVETAPALITETGLKVRVNARHFPVVLPTQTSIVTLLLPHLGVEDWTRALKFTEVTREVLRLSRAAPSNRWDEGFQTLTPTVHVQVLRTHKVSEAYYSSLLPALPVCALNSAPAASVLCPLHHVTQLLPESPVLVVSSRDESSFARCELIHTETLRLRSTLLRFTTTF